MATENAAQGHTTIDEEEVVVAMNWQSGDSNNNESDNSVSYESQGWTRLLITEERAQKGSDEWDSDYIPEKELW
jgi:hypothetical protein